jgi:hypothetical protein
MGQILRLRLPGLNHECASHGKHILMAESFVQGIGQHVGDRLRRHSQTRDIPGGIKTLQGQAVSLV